MTRLRTREELARRAGEDWHDHRRRVQDELMLEHVGLEAHVGTEQAQDAVDWQRFHVGSLVMDTARGAYLADAAATRLVEGDALPPRESEQEVPARGPLLAAVRAALSVGVPHLVGDALDRLPAGWTAAQKQQVRDAMEAAMYPERTRHRRDRSGDDPVPDRTPGPDPARTEAAVDVLLGEAAVSGGYASRFDHDDARALLRALGDAGFLGWGVT